VRGLGRPRGPDFHRPEKPILPGDHGHPAVAPVPTDAKLTAPKGPSTSRTPAGPPGEPNRLVRWAGIAAGAALAGLLAFAVWDFFFDSGPSAASFEPPPRIAAGASGSLRDVAAAVLPSVVSVEVPGRSSGGSGFVVDDNGHIITNAHVIEGASQVQVSFSTGDSVIATIVGTSVDDDIAVLRVDLPSGVEPLRFGRSADVRVGDDVLAVGSPLGLSGTVTAGIISAVDRTVQIGTREATALQTDASINPGNSGGPLVGSAGQVVGVNTTIATLARSGGSIGIGFAIPVDRAADVAERLIEAE